MRERGTTAMGSEKEDGKVMKGGRPMPDNRETLLWNQRIDKELRVNAPAQSGKKFCVRAAVQIPDVPMKFKTGHQNPFAEDARSMRGFVPEEYGWDPQGGDAKDFRRCIDMQTVGSRSRYPLPETAYHEHGWLMAPSGNEAERVRVGTKKVRLGIGWHPTHPSEWSESNAAAPLPESAKAHPSSGSQLSAIAPSILSNGSRHEPAPDASHVSAAAPTQLSLATSVSLPALHEIRSHPEAYLRYRESKVAKRMKESARYLNKGEKGMKWGRPLGSTDATEFDHVFTQKNGGIPLYKTVAHSDEGVVKDPKLGTPAPKWR